MYGNIYERVKEKNMDLINLKEGQYILINKLKYKILNGTKYKEKSSYWIEYKLQDTETGEVFYLNVELSNKVILYKILNDTNIKIKMNITYNGNEYELYEKGNAKVETYFGMTDIGLNEEVSYYEYTNKRDKSEIISIEKWKDETEISIGKITSLAKIKVLNKFEY